MSRIEYYAAILECLFDIFSNIALNVRTMLEKRREYKDEVKNNAK